VLLSCATTPPSTRSPPRGKPAHAAPSAPFQFSQDQLRLIGERPELVHKLHSSPYAYFRLLSDQFAQHVCDEYAETLLDAQTVNLHGDAHIEQYAVTRDGFGLEDFDHGGFGPAVIDLVRFAASIHVACHGASYECRPEPAVEKFLETYRTALNEPDRAPVEPSIVARLRKSASVEPKVFFAWAEQLMTPVVDDDLDRRVRARWRELLGLLTSTDARRPTDEFRIVRYGTIGIGIGSALERKFLIRVVGPSDSPEDDLLLEMKSVPNAGASCVFRGPTGNMFLPLLPAARIARSAPELRTYVPATELSRSGLNWWVRSWDLGYRELSLSDITTQTELVELASDVGLQLGQGHCRLIADPLGAQYRHAHRRWFDRVRPRIVESARANAGATIEAWRAWTLRDRGGTGPDQ
jgi:hypothetical protein